MISYHLKERNCLLQGNIGSIYGHYGRKVKKMMKELLKRNLIDIIGSDIHHPHQDFYNHNLEKDLLKIVKDERLVKDILTNNAKRIIGKSNTKEDHYEQNISRRNTKNERHIKNTKKTNLSHHKKTI